MSAILPMVPHAPAVPTDLALGKQARAYYKLRPERQRSHGFHPSSVSKAAWCPVLAWFVEEANDQLCSPDPAQIAKGFEFKRAILEMDKPDGSLKQEFIRGDQIHEMVQFLLGVIGKLWGVWSCAWCRKKTPEGWMPRTKIESIARSEIFDAAPCMECHGRNLRLDIPWLYAEPSIDWTRTAQELGLSGHMDGILPHFVNGTWYRYVVEIKSINEWGFGEGKNPHWEDLARAEGWQPPPTWRSAFPDERRALPKPEHVTQATVYAVTHEITHIVFIYVNKNQVSQWKEFVVPLDPEAMAKARGRIEVVREARSRNSGPPVHARVCADVRDQTARDCPASERCFGCKAPEGFRW